MNRPLLASASIHALAVLALVAAGTSMIVAAQVPARAPAPAPVAHVVSADRARLSAQIRLLAENVDALDAMPLTLPPAR